MKQSGAILLLFCIFLFSLLLFIYKTQTPTLPKYRIETLVFPKDSGTPFQFTLGYLLNTIKEKKKISIELNEDKFTNQKKIEFIRYEARKLKYTKDTSTIVDISFTNQLTYGELNQSMLRRQSQEVCSY